MAEAHTDSKDPTPKVDISEVVTLAAAAMRAVTDALSGLGWRPLKSYHAGLVYKGGAHRRSASGEVDALVELLVSGDTGEFFIEWMPPGDSEAEMLIKSFVVNWARSVGGSRLLEIFPYFPQALKAQVERADQVNDGTQPHLEAEAVSPGNGLPPGIPADPTDAKILKLFLDEVSYSDIATRLQLELHYDKPAGFVENRIYHMRRILGAQHVPPRTTKPKNRRA